MQNFFWREELLHGVYSPIMFFNAQKKLHFPFGIKMCICFSDCVNYMTKNGDHLFYCFKSYARTIRPCMESFFKVLLPYYLGKFNIWVSNSYMLFLNILCVELYNVVMNDYSLPSFTKLCSLKKKRKRSFWKLQTFPNKIVSKMPTYINFRWFWISIHLR